jgi:hypothetical protein
MPLRTPSVFGAKPIPLVPKHAQATVSGHHSGSLHWSLSFDFFFFLPCLKPQAAMGGEDGSFVCLKPQAAMGREDGSFVCLKPQAAIDSVHVDEQRQLSEFVFGYKYGYFGSPDI